MNMHFIKKMFFRAGFIAAMIAITTSLFLFIGFSSPVLPAHAAPGDCSAVSPAGATGIKTVRSANNNGQQIELRTGKLGNKQYGWARIAYPGQTDLVWMDFSQDGGFTWKQCGPYTAKNRQFSEAVPTSNNADWVFRACGTAGGAPTKCTSWF